MIILINKEHNELWYQPDDIQILDHHSLLLMPAAWLARRVTSQVCIESATLSAPARFKVDHNSITVIAAL
jgi:hypothetical protein